MAKRLDDRGTRHDRFHQQAKREGFLARAVYKLEEIDQKHKIFDGGYRVLSIAPRVVVLAGPRGRLTLRMDLEEERP